MSDELVRPPTLVAATASHIAERIFSGDFKSDQALREVELSQSLGVSRTTIREAQLMLKDEGLVEIIPHRGTFVAELSPRLAREVYSLRALLEPYAVRLAIEGRGYGEQELNELEALLARMAEAHQAADSFAIAKLDVDFHLAICRPSNHLLLMDVLERLQARARFCMMILKVRRLDPGPEEPQHRPILDAIRTQNAAAADSVITQHLRDALSRLLAEMAEVIPEKG
jgi:DNA-binding GntR family transcriptional regulator